MLKMIINALYDTASTLCRVADALSPTSDEVWRGRAWDQWSDRNEAACDVAEINPYCGLIGCKLDPEGH